MIDLSSGGPTQEFWKAGGEGGREVSIHFSDDVEKDVRVIWGQAPLIIF